MSDDFSVEFSDAGSGVFLLCVKGAVSGDTFDRLESAIKNLFDKGHCKLVFDLEGVSYISSSGTGVLMNAFLQAQEIGGNAVFIKLSDNVKSVFDHLRLKEVIVTAPDLESALRILSK